MNGYFWQAAYFPIGINCFILKFRINVIDTVDADGGRFVRVGEHLDIAELLNWNINNAIEIEGFEELVIGVFQASITAQESDFFRGNGQYFD